MTTTELAKLINKTAIYRINGMEFLIKIRDARLAFGRCDALITPVHGQGEKWVDLNNLKLNEN